MLFVRRAVVGPFAENTYVIGCSRTHDAILVDPGGDLPRVLPLVERDGVRIRRIVLTHGHIDHVAGVALAHQQFEAPVQLHAGDREWLAELPRQAEMFGFEGLEVPPEVDHWHEDGERFAVGEFDCQVLHTPGHSAGSCSLWFAAARVLVTGDTLFAGSVGRTDLPGGDFAQLRQSITSRIFPLGDEVRFHPGHGPDGTVGDERASNPFVGEEARRGRFL